MIEKSKALETLKAEFAENPLVSVRTIEEVLETLVQFTNDDTNEDEFLEKVKSVLKTSEGNARKVAAETAKKVKEEKKPTPKKQVQVDEKETEDEEEEKNGSEVPKWVKDLTANFNKQLDEVKKKLEQNDSKEKAELARKEAIEEAREFYGENLVENESVMFDFSQEDAKKVFLKKVGDAASRLGVKVIKGSVKDDFSDIDNFIKSAKESEGIE